MRPTKYGEWECVKEVPKPRTEDEVTADNELDDLWEDLDADELDGLEPPARELTIPLADGDAAAIKKLSNNDAEENLGMSTLR